MKKIRTIVVDDEPLARARIVKLLGQYDYIEVIGECKNGREALQSITDYQPDLVFLDVQMPDLSGFDVLSKAGRGSLPFIIFVTAYDQYALRAFDVHAVDYLLKPYDDERFARSLEHARHHIQLRQNALLHERMLRLLEEHQSHTEQEKRFLEVKEKGHTHRIDLLDVYYVEADGNYLRLHLRDRQHLVRHTLQALEAELDGQVFRRIHRSLLVNTNYLDRIRYQGNNQYLFLLRNGEELLSGRSYRDNVLALFEEESLRRRVDFEL